MSSLLQFITPIKTAHIIQHDNLLGEVNKGHFDKNVLVQSVKLVKLHLLLAGGGGGAVACR